MTDDQNKKILASTAHWTASVRAKESEKGNRLFYDPWATKLAVKDGLDWIAQRSEESVIPIVLRTRFFDDFLIRVTERENIRQVILLAAGLDTRAFRLNWLIHTRVFEIDQAEVLNHKEQILQAEGAKPTCNRTVIKADLNQPWKELLIDSGFSKNQASVWLLEGFLFYLPTAAITEILDQVSGMAVPGSWLGFDIINSDMLTSPITRQWIEMQAKSGAPWIGTMDDPRGFLEQRGWSASLSQAGAEDANHGRWHFPVIPVNKQGIPHNWFVVAQKQKQ